MDEYLQAFIRESEENITELNNALLDLEDNPDSPEAMDSIFRTAHTLKGNFGAMGFQDASDLAHAMEDLLDEIRQGRMEVTPEVMDLVFSGVDQIEYILGEIEENGESSFDPSDTIANIRGVIHNHDADADAATDTGQSGDDAEAESETDADDATADERVEASLAALDDPAGLTGVEGDVFHVAVDMGDPDMKGVDAMFALEGVTEGVDLLGAVPDVDAVSDGDYEDGFDLFVTGDSAGEVESVVSAVGKIQAATVTLVPADAIPSGDREAASDDAAPESDAHSDTGADSDADSGAGSDADSVSASDSDSDSDTDSGSGTGTEAATTPDSGSKGVEEIQSVRIDVEQLDDLHGLVEQLVTSRIKLRRSIEQQELDSAGDNMDELDKITSNLQDTVMDMRLVPLKKVVDKFPRLVRDLARSQDKNVDFEIEGEDIELDRTILNEMGDPLMHLLRNSVDHGIEPPEEREAAGKPREGTVRLRASRERDRVTIEVEDDGSGIDPDVLRNKAVEKGIMTRSEADALDDQDAQELVFHAGFSTNDEVTDVSGRGVGMDVVKNTITRLDGSVTVDSTPGEGTTFSVSLPVTVAIVKVLFVESGDEEYGIPIKNVDEIRRMGEIKTIEGEEVITHDDTVYPIVRLGEALNVPDATLNGDGMLVRVRKSERQVAIHCDSVSRQEEVVVKPFEGILSGIPGLSGAAVLGEGDVVTILDVESL